MKINWFDISYLQNGSISQKKALTTLKEIKILEILASFRPVVVGTYPIDIAIATSDLDILCQIKDFEYFIEILNKNFSNFSSFKTHKLFLQNDASIICRFNYNNMPFEIVGQNKPIEEQTAFLHMIHEAAILEKYGPKFKNQIIELKKKGIKTEPAFAQLLSLPGNPYISILNY